MGLTTAARITTKGKLSVAQEKLNREKSIVGPFKKVAEAPTTGTSWYEFMLLKLAPQSQTNAHEKKKKHKCRFSPDILFGSLLGAQEIRRNLLFCKQKSRN